MNPDDRSPFEHLYDAVEEPIDRSGDGIASDAAPSASSVPGSAERSDARRGARSVAEATTRRASAPGGGPASVEACSSPECGCAATRPRARLDTYGDNYPTGREGVSDSDGRADDDKADTRVERLAERSRKEKRADNARRKAYQRLDIAQEITSLKSLAGCMRWPARWQGGDSGDGDDEPKEIEIRVATHEDGEKSAYYAKVQTCKSPWSCPVCSRKIRQRHSIEAEIALKKHIGQGGAAMMGLLTVPHTSLDSLPDLLSAVQEAWSYITTHSTWARRRKEWGYAGYVRSIEITHGPNGWHPHVHYVLCTDRVLTTKERRACATLLHRLFAKAVEERGLKRPLRGLCRLEPVRSAEKAGQYVAKGDGGKDWNAALELMRHDLKEDRHDEPTRHGHVTPFQILDRYGTFEDESDSDLWYEYEQATRGVRSVTWSQGQYDLRDRYDVKEATDEQLAHEDQEESEVVASIPRQTWRWICMQRRARGRLLVIARLGDYDWLEEEIDDHRMERARYIRGEPPG